ncbi:MAG: RNA methyltransferase [Leptospiraceae bacterium]|jgi:TrmH family RNA methyltransferase|nr:RNA methyltransferase [Leptospiraceae bacterium]
MVVINTMNILNINSFSNEKVKYVIKLKEKRFRDRERKFVIEGYRELAKANLSGKIKFDTLYISPECFLGVNEDDLIRKINVKTIELPRKIFEKISYRDRPDGLLAVADTPDFGFDYEGDKKGSLFLIIEGVEKPGNLGTILRTADGAGVSAVFVTDARIDLFNPNVIRASTGTVFTLPTYIAEIEKLIEYFQKYKVQIIALSPEGNQNYLEPNYKLRTALLFGNEQYGLSPYAKENSDSLVSIPMQGESDSLNLAMSCGIMVYEVLRQKMQRK